MTKKVKSISFNDNNQEEKEMLQHIGKRNFSKYVKDLIHNDMILVDAKKPNIKEAKTKYQGTANQYYQAQKPPQTEPKRYKSNNGVIKFNIDS
jgi:hypothetical protein